MRQAAALSFSEEAVIDDCFGLLLGSLIKLYREQGLHELYTHQGCRKAGLKIATPTVSILPPTLLTVIPGFLLIISFLNGKMQKIPPTTCTKLLAQAQTLFQGES